MFRVIAFALAFITTLGGTAFAADKPELRIGSVIALTGPASALGLPARNALVLLEEELAKDKSLPFTVKFITYDDASDPTRAVNGVRKLVSEDRVHVVICCSTTPASMAILETVTQAQVPNISLALAASVISPASERKWIFKTPSTDRLQVSTIIDDIIKRGGKRIAFFGQEDSYGEGGWLALNEVAKEKGLQIVAAERFARTDTNFTPQALRIRQANPDAVYFHAIPPSSVLSHQALKRVGYTGPIYHSGGSANNAFINLGKADVEGAFVATTPVLIYSDLPDSNPLRASITKFAASYEKRVNVEKVDIFPGQAWDAGNIILAAVRKALASNAKLEDVAAARAAIRNAIETTTNFVGVGGIFDYSATDHLGLDQRSTFIAEVKNGKFVLYRSK
ncbi:MAG: ABC transporter substrate-binding protein [Xanthobacteraceae bacterium]